MPKARHFSQLKRWLPMVVASIFMLSGVYVIVLTQLPRLMPSLPLLKSSIDLDTGDDITDHRDRLQIEKLNLEVPFLTGNSLAVLDQGAWHRFPDRGDPARGGNFILSGHRFSMGFTPQGTRAKSPFYNLNKLVVGDPIRVYYKNKWYEYHVTKIYSVKPTQVDIENPSATPKMTLYSCTMKGAADGRYVIEAMIKS